MDAFWSSNWYCIWTWVEIEIQWRRECSRWKNKLTTCWSIRNVERIGGAWPLLSYGRVHRKENYTRGAGGIGRRGLIADEISVLLCRTSNALNARFGLCPRGWWGARCWGACRAVEGQGVVGWAPSLLWCDVCLLLRFDRTVLWDCVLQPLIVDVGYARGYCASEHG